jgi:hypothetical protein
VTNGLMPVIAAGFAIPLLMLLVGSVKNALPPGVGKGWVWLTVLFIFLVAGRSGLLESVGFDRRAAMQWVIVCGMGMAVVGEYIGRVRPRPQ